MHEHDIGFRIKTLSNLVRRRVESMPVKQYADKLTGVHGWIIGYIYNSPKDIYQRDLEKDFKMRRSTATVMLQMMEKNGMIRRESVQSDARLKKLVLTPKAIELHDNIKREIEQLEAEMKKGLTDQEIQAFFSITEKIQQNLIGGTHD